MKKLATLAALAGALTMAATAACTSRNEISWEG